MNIMKVMGLALILYSTTYTCYYKKIMACPTRVVSVRPQLAKNRRLVHYINTSLVKQEESSSPKVTILAMRSIVDTPRPQTAPLT